MTAFATYTDLGVRMQRTFTAGEQPWITALLEDAAGLMRGVMRQQVYPSTQAEYTAYPVGGRVDLPQAFIRTIDSVVQDGTTLTYSQDGSDSDSYTRFEDSLKVPSNYPVTITVTYGLDEAPQDLIAINCVIVSSAILTIEAGTGLTAGGLSSVAIDDFKAAWADAGEQSGLTIPPLTVDYLTKQYGVTGWVVNTR